MQENIFKILQGWNMAGENEILPVKNNFDGNSVDFSTTKSDDELKEIVFSCQNDFGN